MLSHVKFQFIFDVLVLFCLFVFCVFPISLKLKNIFSVNYNSAEAV